MLEAAHDMTNQSCVHGFKHNVFYANGAQAHTNSAQTCDAVIVSLQITSAMAPAIALLIVFGWSVPISS